MSLTLAAVSSLEFYGHAEKGKSCQLLLMFTSGNDDFTVFGQLMCHFLINVS